jgi:hypothetical protein
MGKIQHEIDACFLAPFFLCHHARHDKSWMQCTQDNKSKQHNNTLNKATEKKNNTNNNLIETTRMMATGRQENHHFRWHRLGGPLSTLMGEKA